MKKILFTWQAALLSVLVLVMSSCEVNVIEDNRRDFTDYTWVGDVGMTDHKGEPVYSVFDFSRNGRGLERQYYMSDDAYYNEFVFYWEWDHRYNDIILDYGQNGVSYMENINFSGRFMYGVFYIDDYDTRGFRFQLERRY